MLNRWLKQKRECTKCRIEKKFSEFPKSSKSSLGIDTRCKLCAIANTKRYVVTNIDKVKATRRQQYERTKNERAAYVKNWMRDNKQKRLAWRLRNKEKLRSQFREWSERNKSKLVAKKARRRSAKLCATPSWVKAEDFLYIYKECREMTKSTGVEYQVDHIVPLQGENVCGLHVPWNLQILSKIENVRKKNKLI